MICVGVLMFIDTEGTKEYLSIRYKAFHDFALSSFAISSYIKSDLVARASLTVIRALACFVALGSLPLLLDMKLLTILHAYMVMIVGGLLHMPYETEPLNKNVVGQIRKLIFFFAVFCGMLIVVSTHRPPSIQSKKPKKE